jgi:hypothetical protein
MHLKMTQLQLQMQTWRSKSSYHRKGRRRQVWELVTTASHYIIQPRNLLKLIAAAAFELPARCDLRRTLQNILSCNSKIK